MQPDAPVLQASLILFTRYCDIIEQARLSGPDPFAQDARLSLENLAWLCTCAQREGAQLPVDKISRWLGFIQGCLAMRGLVDVDTERDVSRPLFHAAYREANQAPPLPRERGQEQI